MSIEVNPLPKKKVALITGITGQDGSYLTEFLLSKNYEIHGLRRRISSLNSTRIDHLYNLEVNKDKKIFLHHGDMMDSLSLTNLISNIKPDEIYNLAAQSHVHVSFESPEYTGNVNAFGPLRILESIRILELSKSTKFYQASTSELYGKVLEKPQDELTPFNPQSPYAISKQFAHATTINYRNSYGIFAVNGILFNHESPVRGETFVTRKITQGIARIISGKQKYISLGNLDSLRDWGHARDYVRAQWMIMQNEFPKDYVIATGEQHTVREFVELAFANVGIDIVWRGAGEDEVAIDAKGRKLIVVDKRYLRPSEVDDLLGNANLARNELGWKPEYSFEQLVAEMVASDMQREQQGL